jgi:hypothetical protein
MSCIAAADVVACSSMCRNRATSTTKEHSDPMKRTVLAQHQAPVAGAARSCGGSGLGNPWRAEDMSRLGFANALTTKRPARHLGNATT